ncbi:hypothetical protein AcV7_002957 [Taiwanofungus camphoratus]|nr:hypothetical protein AcW2_006082 [Antrodia cinnamomea]KAI0941357.1 hypothetical protein AcV7_002957 [Antrodia cinnamomea]
MSAPAPFTAAHRRYVQSLYKRYLNNDLNWTVRRDLWRARALAIRAEFERNRDVHDPRALAEILAKAEADLAVKIHPDPYRREYNYHSYSADWTKKCISVSCRGC